MITEGLDQGPLHGGLSPRKPKCRTRTPDALTEGTVLRQTPLMSFYRPVFIEAKVCYK
jgi:hypothetical protein